MSVEFSGYRESRLLPENMENDLRAWANGCAGWSLLVFVAFGLTSLLSWSAQDMNIGMATQDLRNLFGPLGALFSDFLMKCFGVTAMVLFLPLAHWGWMLKKNTGIDSWKQRVFLWPLSIVLLAGASAFIPRAETWPLVSGYGGIVGDVVFSLVNDFIGSFNPVFATPLAIAVLSVAGATALASSMAMTFQDMVVIFSLRGKPGRSRSLLIALPMRWLWALIASITSMWAVLSAPFARQKSDLAYQTGFASDGQLAPEVLYSDPPFDSVVRERDFDSETAAPAARDAYAEMQGAEFDIEEPSDPLELEASRRIAQRFAPRSASNGKSAPVVEKRSDPAGQKSAAGTVFFGNRKEEPRQSPMSYQRPSLDMLKQPPNNQPRSELDESVLRGNAGLLQDVLMDFGVEGRIVDIKPGPVVTLFEFEPARGVKSSRVIALADDIARSMSAVSARIAVVPGRNVIGIELPNSQRETVYLSELFASDSYLKNDLTLPMALGKNISGGPVVVDLARMPHLLIAGTTGSGKSVGLNAMILSLLYSLSPDQCKFIMIDPKMLELSVYNDIPHLLTPVVTDSHKAVGTLNWVVREMEERYKKMSMLGVRSVQAFNNTARASKAQGRLVTRKVQTGYHPETGAPIIEEHSLELDVLPFIVVVIDELADLMAVAGKEIEHSLQRLAQMARAAGIHLIMATQRPSVDVVTGTIKSNFPTRISFKVATKIDSRTILSEPGAEQLLGHGDMLYSTGPGQMSRVHGPLVEDGEVEKITSFLRQQGRPQYVEALSAVPEPSQPAGGNDKAGEREDLFERAVAIVMTERKVSTSYIQRRLSIGYNRAADIIDRMEEEGLISAPGRTGKRKILVGESE